MTPPCVLWLVDLAVGPLSFLQACDELSFPCRQNLSLEYCVPSGGCDRRQGAVCEGGGGMWRCIRLASMGCNGISLK